MHYFIDHLQLTAQATFDQFGPDFNNPSTLYNVTSRFQLINVCKAFACQPSMMIVQQSSVDSSLVNVILKPIEGLKTILDVKYYIYRGILKSSLINGTDIVSNAPNNNELIARIWSVAPSSIVSFNAGILGFDNNTFPGTDHVESIYDFSRTNVRPILVKEGEWFGDFTASYKIGFEIILETDRINIDLNYVRDEFHQVDVTGLANLALRAKREEILSYIDPAAFFGCHYDAGIDISTYSFNIKTTVRKKQDDIYTLLLDNKFSTKNRVYFDVRSEKGYSYNFYQNYRDVTDNDHDIKIGYGNQAPIAQRYSDEWPIAFIDTAQVSTTSKNNIRFHLRIDDNFRPIIYITNKDIQEQIGNNRRFHYITRSSIVPNVNPTEWSNELRFLFPNTGLISPKDNVAFYIKIYYFRQEHNTNNFPAAILRNEKYYDSAFCSVDLRDLGDPLKADMHIQGPHWNYIREVMRPNGTGNFGYAAKNGAFWDSQRILFYSNILIPEETMPITSEKFYLNTYERRLEIANTLYTRSEIRRHTNVICREYVINNVPRRILGINSYKPNQNFSTKECLMFLGLTIAEITAIRNSNSNNLELSALSDRHHRYIFLEPDPANPLFDGSVINNVNMHFRYHRYTVRLQGLDANGNRNIITPQLNASSIFVYSRDNQFFHSLDFSAGEVITNAEMNIENKIAFHVYHDGTVKITDNIDLSLVRKTSDPANAGDLSLVQQISYSYRPTDIAAFDPVCQLDIWMANKMQRRPGNNGIVPNIPNGFVQSFDYGALNVAGVFADRSYTNGDEDIVTTPVAAHANLGIRRYNNQKKKVFLVHFVAASVNASLLIGNRFNYTNTLRHFPSPSVAASTIGALISINDNIFCQGFAYRDASCYPSAEHVNGEALDTNYLLVPDQVIFMTALFRYGFTRFRIGANLNALQLALAATPFYANHVLVDPIGVTLHNGHHHAANVVLIDRNKIL